MPFLIKNGYQKNTLYVEKHQQVDYWRDFICQEFVQLDCTPLDTEMFSGEIRGGLNYGQLSISEVICDAQTVTRTRQQISRANEANFLISFQLQQQGLVKQNGREAILSPGSFVLYDSSEPYSLNFNQRFHQLIVQMPKAVLSQYLINPEQYTAVAVSGQDGIGMVLNNFIYSLVMQHQQLDSIHSELADNLLNMIAMAYSSSLMCQQIKPQSYVREALVNRIKHYIECNYASPQLSNQRIADTHGISLRYLYKLFHNQEIGLHQLIMHKRMEKSKSLLLDAKYTNCSLENISYVVGFTSSAHFSRAFKNFFGASPSDFR